MSKNNTETNPVQIATLIVSVIASVTITAKWLSEKFWRSDTLTVKKEQTIIENGKVTVNEEEVTEKDEQKSQLISATVSAKGSKTAPQSPQSKPKIDTVAAPSPSLVPPSDQMDELASAAITILHSTEGTDALKDTSKQQSSIFTKLAQLRDAINDILSSHPPIDHLDVELGGETTALIHESVEGKN